MNDTGTTRQRTAPAGKISQRPFTQVHSDVLRDPTIKPHLKAFYALVLSYSYQDCFTVKGQEGFARDMGVDVRTIRRWLRDLEALGLIETERRGKCKTNRTRVPHIVEDLRSQTTGHDSPVLPDTDVRSINTNNREQQQGYPAAGGSDARRRGTVRRGSSDELGVDAGSGGAGQGGGSVPRWWTGPVGDGGHARQPVLAGAVAGQQLDADSRLTLRHESDDGCIVVTTGWS